MTHTIINDYKIEIAELRKELKEGNSNSSQQNTLITKIMLLTDVVEKMESTFKKDNQIYLTKKELKLIEKSLWNRVNTMGVDEIRTYESILEKIENKQL
jgi:hypothetical protein